MFYHFKGRLSFLAKIKIHWVKTVGNKSPNVSKLSITAVHPDQVEPPPFCEKKISFTCSFQTSRRTSSNAATVINLFLQQWDYVQLEEDDDDEKSFINWN